MKTLWTALMEPNRVQIVELLRDGPLAVGEITERLGLQQPQISKHLKVLNEAGIVEVQPRANRRIYQLRRKPFQELEAWLHSFRRLWEERFDRLDDYLLDLKEALKVAVDMGMQQGMNMTWDYLVGYIRELSET